MNGRTIREDACGCDIFHKQKKSDGSLQLHVYARSDRERESSQNSHTSHNLYGRYVDGASLSISYCAAHRLTCSRLEHAWQASLCNQVEVRSRDSIVMGHKSQMLLLGSVPLDKKITHKV